MCLTLAAILFGWLLVALYAGVSPRHPKHLVLFLLATVALVVGATVAATRSHVRQLKERRQNERDRQESEPKSGVESASP